MAPRSHLIPFTFLSILVVTVPILAASGGTIIGGWQRIGNPKDPEVVKVAKFAVAEHNKDAHSSLVFASVVDEESKVVAGTMYRLLISTTNGRNAVPIKCRAVVYSKPRQKLLVLVSFEEM